MGGKIALSGIPNKGEQNQKCAPTKGSKIRSGCLTPIFSGAQKRAEMLRHPCILGDPQHRGTKSEVAASPLPSWGPKRGRKRYVTLAFSGVPYRRGRKQKWPTTGRKCYVILAFSGVPKQGDKVKGGHKWAEVPRNPDVLGGPRKGVQKWPAPGSWKKSHSGGP